MQRRDILLSAGAALAGLTSFPCGCLPAADPKRQKILYFTRNCLHEHDPVRRREGELSVSENLLIEWGKSAGFEVDYTKDGSVFDGDLDQYQAIVFYTSGTCEDLMGEKSIDKAPPISARGKQRLFDVLAAGTGAVAIHSGFYISCELFGTGYSGHGTPQAGTMRITSPDFPGVQGLGSSFSLFEEWFTFQDQAKDLHVILVQDTGPMQHVEPRPKKQDLYERPPFPATWARRQGKTRVFYTSLGHFNQVWETAVFKQILLGGLAWAMGNAKADVTPNIDRVAPLANQRHL